MSSFKKCVYTQTNVNPQKYMEIKHKIDKYKQKLELKNAQKNTLPSKFVQSMPNFIRQRFMKTEEKEPEWVNVKIGGMKFFYLSY